MWSTLWRAADEEAEMAGVMAHEIAHVAACHYGREMTRANLMQLASLPAIFVGGAIGYGIYQGLGLAIPLTFLHFSRAFESEADYFGIEYMYRAGYDLDAEELWVLGARFAICSRRGWVERTRKRCRRECW
jgi:predicted Zn-dependent protease